MTCVKPDSDFHTTHVDLCTYWWHRQLLCHFIETKQCKPCFAKPLFCRSALQEHRKWPFQYATSKFLYQPTGSDLGWNPTIPVTWVIIFSLVVMKNSRNMEGESPQSNFRFKSVLTTEKSKQLLGLTTLSSVCFVSLC